MYNLMNGGGGLKPQSPRPGCTTEFSKISTKILKTSKSEWLTLSTAEDK